MVALSILAISLTVLMHTFSRGLMAAEKTQTASKEAFLARTVMEEAFLGREPIEGTESGSFDQEPRYSWERTVELYEELPPLFEEEDEILRRRDEEDEEPFQVYRIRVRVHRSGRSGRGLTLETLRTFLPPEEDR